MAYYLVRAKPKDNLSELSEKLADNSINKIYPYGSEMQDCLSKARIDDEGYAIWEELCYCNPPLKQERSILTQYFTDIRTQTVSKGEGWIQIENLPLLWD